MTIKASNRSQSYLLSLSCHQDQLFQNFDWTKNEIDKSSILAGLTRKVAKTGETSDREDPTCEKVCNKLEFHSEKSHFLTKLCQLLEIGVGAKKLVAGSIPLGQDGSGGIWQWLGAIWAPATATSLTVFKTLKTFCHVCFL